MSDEILLKAPIGIMKITNELCVSVNDYMKELLCKTDVIGKSVKEILPDLTEELDKKKVIKSVPYMRQNDSILFLTINVEPMDVNTVVLYVTDKRGHLDKDNIVSLALTERIMFEMRKALNGIVGSSILLSDTKLTQDQLECLRCIRQSEIDMMLAINDVSDFIKLKTNRYALDVKPFNITGLVDDCTNMVNEKLRAKNISYHAKIGKHVHSQITTDMNILKKILIKLLNNAIDFSEESGRVDMLVEKNGHSAIQIRVIDKGRGMSDEVRKKIFIDSDFKQSEGLGLSLILCKMFSQLMGGDISFETQLNVGTTFVLNIQENKRQAPNVKQLKDKRILVVTDNETDKNIISVTLAECKANPIAISQASEAMAIISSGLPIDAVIVKAEYTLSAGKIPVIEIVEDSQTSREHTQRLLLKRPIDKYKILEACKNIIVEDKRFLRKTSIPILIVDDSATSRTVVSKQLNKLGYDNLDVAIDGEDALRKINAKSYSVIFLDLIMPKMSGWDVMEQIMISFGKKSKPYVIAMTANELTTDKSKALQCGMNDFIVKPITSDNINRVLQNI